MMYQVKAADSKKAKGWNMAQMVVWLPSTQSWGSISSTTQNSMVAKPKTLSLEGGGKKTYKFKFILGSTVNLRST